MSKLSFQALLGKSASGEALQKRAASQAAAELATAITAAELGRARLRLQALTHTAQASLHPYYYFFN